MTKLINKADCKFEAGHIVKDDELIGISRPVYYQLNELELIVQQHKFLAAQPKHSPAPSLNGFVRKTSLRSDRPYVKQGKTPVTDAREKEALKFMAECDEKNDVDKINATIDRFGELVDWCAGDKFVEGLIVEPLDLVELGNPLELKPEKIVEIISEVVKNPVSVSIEI